MVDLTWEIDHCEGITFVAAIVTNTQLTAQRVRIATCLEGPTWPPRHNGVTAPEWDDGIWEGVIDPGRHRGVGFATPAPPTTPPIELVSVSRVTDRSATTTEILASLSASTPPVDVCTDR